MKNTRPIFTRLRVLVFCVSLLSLTSIGIVVSAETGFLVPADQQTATSTPAAQTAPVEKTVGQYTDCFKDLKLQGQFSRISYGGRNRQIDRL